MRRCANEDCYALEPELGLFLVADGMGGHNAGQVASELAAEGVLEAVRGLEGRSVRPTEKLRQAVEVANRRIVMTALAKSEPSGMGTTLVAILASGRRVELAHVGESRAYPDGLTTHLCDDEIAQWAASGAEPQAICDALVAQANQRGGEDNITVVLVRFDPAQPQGRS